MRKIIFFVIFLSTQIMAVNGWADIYRFDDGDADGVISFTDAPRENRYTLIMKESRSQRLQYRQNRSPLLSDPSNAAPKSLPGLSASIADTLPIQGVITSPTGLRHDPFDGRLRHHKGMDIAAPSGTPVKPVAPGTVIFSGWRNGYGNTVIIEHNDGMTTVYAHHDRNLVTEGSPVDRVTTIALSGSTGRSTGPHLHFEAWRSGENITQTFMPTGTTAQKPLAIASAPIRRFLQEDGTILFTNLR
jgi:murein DD-endopeptidase MepM/ murein hydrolase activator NlpD